MKKCLNLQNQEILSTWGSKYFGPSLGYIRPWIFFNTKLGMELTVVRKCVSIPKQRQWWWKKARRRCVRALSSTADDGDGRQTGTESRGLDETKASAFRRDSDNGRRRCRRRGWPIEEGTHHDNG